MLHYCIFNIYYCPEDVKFTIVCIYGHFVPLFWTNLLALHVNKCVILHPKNTRQSKTLIIVIQIATNQHKKLSTLNFLIYDKQGKTEPDFIIAP